MNDGEIIRFFWNEIKWFIIEVLFISKVILFCILGNLLGMKIIKKVMVMFYMVIFCFGYLMIKFKWLKFLLGSVFVEFFLELCL